MQPQTQNQSWNQPGGVQPTTGGIGGTQVEKSVVQTTTFLPPGQPTQPVGYGPVQPIQQQQQQQQPMPIPMATNVQPGGVAGTSTATNVQPGGVAGTSTATNVQPGGVAGTSTATQSSSGSKKAMVMAKQVWTDLKGAALDISTRFNQSMAKTSTTGAGAGRTGSVGGQPMQPGATAPLVGTAGSTQVVSTATYPAGTLPQGSFPTATSIAPAQVLPPSSSSSSMMGQQQQGTIGQQPQLAGTGNIPVYDPK